MEAIIVLLLIGIILLLITRSNSLGDRLQKMEEQLRILSQRMQNPDGASQKTTRNVEAENKEQISRPAPTPMERWSPKAEAIIPKKEEEPVAVKPETVIPPVPAPLPAPVPPPAYTPPPKPGFFERNPDLEKFIGENLVSKIGIAILVIAIAFFVKFAIDSNWIREAGRVCIGILCGGILIGLAHRLQKNYHAFSSVLVGGGIAVFYFTIALAYRDYGMFGQTTAFVIMVGITIMAILLSLLYDRQEVAIIALTGGFAVPFMVSNGSGNYAVLFCYLLVLNAGILIIAFRKGWRLLNGLAFGFTVLLFGAWLFTLADEVAVSTPRNGFLFATAFYLLFLGINLAHNIREQRRFIASDFGILLANTALYFSAGLYLLYTGAAVQYKGLFSAAMAVLNLAISYQLFRYQKVDKNVLYLLIGITLTFVSVTAPLQLHAHFITLFWASECVVLWWLYIQSRIKLLQIGFCAVWAATLISLGMDWAAVYGNDGPVPLIIFNRGAMTSIFVIASQSVLYRLMRRSDDADSQPAHLVKPYVFLIVALALGLIAGELELHYQLSMRAGSSVADVYLPLYAVAYFTGVYYGLRNKIADTSWKIALPLLSGASVFLYLAALPQFVAFQQGSILMHHTDGYLAAHCALLALSALAFYCLCQTIRGIGDVMLRNAGAWIGSAIATVIVSTEAYILINAVAAHDAGSLARIADSYVRVGLPIIWGLCSFALMYLGFKFKERMLRVIALTLFGITLLKLFLFDIRDISPAGKIAAFFCLGILLLVVSFMYQRLKKIIVDDTRNNEES